MFVYEYSQVLSGKHRKSIPPFTWLIPVAYPWLTWLIPANPSTFCGIFLHLNHVLRILQSSQNITESQILQSIDSHQMDDKSLIQGTLSQSKDNVWAVMLCTIANDACQSGTERKRLRQEMDR